MFKHYLKNVMVLLLVLGLVFPVFAQEKGKKKGKKHYVVIEKERAEFHQLLIRNVNYFGTFPG